MILKKAVPFGAAFFWVIIFVVSTDIKILLECQRYYSHHQQNEPRQLPLMTGQITDKARPGQLLLALDALQRGVMFGMAKNMPSPCNRSTGKGAHWPSG